MPASFCDLVPHVPIDESTMRVLERDMATAAGKFAAYHKRSTAKTVSDFYCEFVREFAPGKDVYSCGVNVPAEDASVMIRTRQLESQVMAGFSPLIQRLVRRSSSGPRSEPENLYGEAFKALQKAMLYYNGETKFLTFLHICLQRHLSRASFGTSAVRVPDDVRKATMRVVDRMTRDRVSFDSAVQSEGLSREKSKRVVAAMSKVCTASDLGVRESQLVWHTDRPSCFGVREAIAAAKLGRLERAVLEGFMNAPAGKMGLSDGCEGLVNPGTGRPYSRAAISTAWKKARAKLEPFLRGVA